MFCLRFLSVVANIGVLFNSSWDLYRSVFPLITIIDPTSLRDMINSLINIFQHEGWLPDCRMSLCKGFTQGGSNADVLIGDAFLKNVTGINSNDAYAAVLQDAEVEPLDWSVEGRGGLTSWKTLGYIPADDFDPYGVGPQTRSISRTIEYAYNDFVIAEIAKGLGNDADYIKYIARSGNWHNVFLPNQTSNVNGVPTGFTGFLQARYSNGTWGSQNPAACSPLLDPDSCFLYPTGTVLETYEASIWLYTLYVHT
jgi:putative alpha-1,2-mannosidase